MSPDDLIGFAEIAAMLGVARSTAARYSNRDDFPEPTARLASGPVWRRADVEAWGKEHLPLPAGRPPKQD